MALLQALQAGPQHGDYSPVYQAIQQRMHSRAQQHAQQLAPHVEVASGARVPAGASQVVQLAQKYLGTKYTWGGASPKTGFDCSGFAQWLYGHFGVHLPRTSQQQWRVGTPVARNQLKPGDLLFFEPGASGPGHEAMYIGNGHMIEAPHTGATVRIASINRADYMGARRVH
jgi:cell wall-associated NlpC family hydrolase